MSRNQKVRQMEQVIQDANLPQRELINLLAMYMSEFDPQIVAEWFSEMTESREDSQQRINELLAEWNERDLIRFDPMI